MSQVTLKERSGQAAVEQDLQTVFSLFPVIQEGDVIIFESYARIKHLATRTWLHLDRGEWKIQKRTQSSGGGLCWGSSEWLGTTTP